MIIAVAVKADGYELTDRYLISNDINGASNNLAARLVRDRTEIKQYLDSTFKSIPSIDQFSSFFSRLDIQKLTDPSLSFSGIYFYTAEIQTFSRMPDRLKNLPGNIRTHLAIPANLSSEGMSVGSTNLLDFENIQHAVVSDRPCQGHCPTVTNVEEVNNGTALPIVEIGRSPASGLDTNNDPYIVKWEQGT